MGRIYISRDIVFDETIFPFASLHSNAGARLRAEIDLLPFYLQPLNLHYHEGHDLQEPIDVNPTNAANPAAESFLQDTDQNYTSDNDSGDFSVSGVDFGAYSFASPGTQSSAPVFPGRFSSGSHIVLNGKGRAIVNSNR
jgi:hypothetical protein